VLFPLLLPHHLQADTA
jgi:hypothetical protein